MLGLGLQADFDGIEGILDKFAYYAGYLDYRLMNRIIHACTSLTDPKAMSRMASILLLLLGKTSGVDDSW